MHGSFNQPAALLLLEPVLVAAKIRRQASLAGCWLLFFHRQLLDFRGEETSEPVVYDTDIQPWVGAGRDALSPFESARGQNPSFSSGDAASP